MLQDPTIFHTSSTDFGCSALNIDETFAGDLEIFLCSTTNPR